LRLNYYGAFVYIIFPSIITGQEFFGKNMVLICAFGKTLDVTLLRLEKENKSYIFSV